VRRPDGTLWVWSSQADAFRQVADHLRRYDWVVGLGDLDGNGRADVLARRRTTGRLFLLPGGAHRLGAPRLVAAGFGGYDLGG
jgi:hypothetical protein